MVSVTQFASTGVSGTPSSYIRTSWRWARSSATTRLTATCSGWKSTIGGTYTIAASASSGSSSCRASRASQCRSTRPRQTSRSMPRIAAAASASWRRRDAIVSGSTPGARLALPSVTTATATWSPAATWPAIVPPAPSVSSSGCAATTRMRAPEAAVQEAGSARSVLPTSDAPAAHALSTAGKTHRRASRRAVSDDIEVATGQEEAARIAQDVPGKLLREGCDADVVRSPARHETRADELAPDGAGSRGEHADVPRPGSPELGARGAEQVSSRLGRTEEVGDPRTSSLVGHEPVNEISARASMLARDEDAVLEGRVGSVAVSDPAAVAHDQCVIGRRECVPQLVE